MTHTERPILMIAWTSFHLSIIARWKNWDEKMPIIQQTFKIKIYNAIYETDVRRTS